MSVIHRIFDRGIMDSVRNEKSLPTRIRRKAMICQTEIWEESFNLVFE